MVIIVGYKPDCSVKQGQCALEDLNEPYCIGYVSYFCIAKSAYFDVLLAGLSGLAKHLIATYLFGN